MDRPERPRLKQANLLYVTLLRVVSADTLQRMAKA
jgi:hypothetical protein